MRDAIVTAAFEHVQRTDDVALDVAVWILQRVPYAGLCAQVNHALELVVFEQGRDRGAISQIRLHKAKGLIRAQQAESSAFQRDLVIVVQIVQADDLVAAIEQTPRRRSTNESGGAGDEHFHGGQYIPPTPSARVRSATRREKRTQIAHVR